MEKSCGSIVIYDDLVLIVKQNKGHYGFPKGHMEKGESEVETAIRETKEETNIDIIIENQEKKYYIKYMMNNGIAKEVTYFIGKPLNHDIKKQDSEIGDALWVPKDEVYDILTYGNMKRLWKKILKNL